MRISAKGRFLCQAAVILGTGFIGLQAVLAWDSANQASNAPRPLPEFYAGNPAGYNLPRVLQEYGAPFYGGVGSNVATPLSLEEYRTTFMFDPSKIPEVLVSLGLPADPVRVALGHEATFPYRFLNGVATRWVKPETALLVFLRRMRTRGSVLMADQRFWGRSVGWQSEVFNSVLDFVSTQWVPLKIQSLDTRVFNRWRLQDYADKLWDCGLKLPGIVGFVDGTFHSIYRPGRDGYAGILQQCFYSGDKKGHGLVFEMITFPDGMVGRAFGPVSGRHHDHYLARRSRLLHLLVQGGLRGFRLFGDKAYVGFGARIIHPFIAAAVGSVQAAWNTHTSAYRISVENDIGNIYSRCACLQNDMRLETQVPENWFQVAVLMNNIHTCVYHNSQTAIRFGCAPPSLQEYMQK